MRLWATWHQPLDSPRMLTSSERQGSARPKGSSGPLPRDGWRRPPRMHPPTMGVPRIHGRGRAVNCVSEKVRQDGKQEGSHAGADADTAADGAMGA
jgi:hypothetical protein